MTSDNYPQGSQQGQTGDGAQKGPLYLDLVFTISRDGHPRLSSVVAATLKRAETEYGRHCKKFYWQLCIHGRTWQKILSHQGEGASKTHSHVPDPASDMYFFL